VLPDKIVTFDRQGTALGGNYADGQSSGEGCNKGRENVTAVKAPLSAGVPATKAEKRTAVLSNLISSALMRKTNTLDPRKQRLGQILRVRGRGTQ